MIKNQEPLIHMQRLFNVMGDALSFEQKIKSKQLAHEIGQLIHNTEAAVAMHALLGMLTIVHKQVERRMQ